MRPPAGDMGEVARLCRKGAGRAPGGRRAAAGRGGGGPEGRGSRPNQLYVEEVTAPSRLDVTDMKAVLRTCWRALPDEVTVYPTENYFYFGFYEGGIRWAGNLRLDAETRDLGKIHMTYFKDFTAWQQDETDYTKVWGADDGVTVEKTGPLAYRVTFEGRSVLFRLNDLSDVTPPEGVLLPGERYLGPVFDESGIRFFLVFRRRSGSSCSSSTRRCPTPDEFAVSPVSDRLTLGRRTGFAFYADRMAPRKISSASTPAPTGVKQLPRRPVRPAAGQLPEGQRTARRDPDGEPGTRRHPRPLRQLRGRQRPLSDRAVHAVRLRRTSFHPSPTASARRRRGTTGPASAPAAAGDGRTARSGSVLLSPAARADEPAAPPAPDAPAPPPQ